MKIRAGRLRQRLTLQTQVETRTATGDVSIAWTTDSTVWGSIEPRSGREFLAASQTQNEIPVRIVMRYHATIADSWRIVNDGLSYSIISITNSDMRDHMMEILCSQGVMEKDSLALFVVNSGVQIVNSGNSVVYTA